MHPPKFSQFPPTIMSMIDSRECGLTLIHYSWGLLTPVLQSSLHASATIGGGILLYYYINSILHMLTQNLMKNSYTLYLYLFSSNMYA